MMKHGKRIADLLTISRGLLGVGIAVLGVVGGKDALPLVVLLMILAWLTDLLDGVFARRDPDPAPSRLSGHDAKADMAVGLGVMAYLALIRKTGVLFFRNPVFRGKSKNEFHPDREMIAG